MDAQKLRARISFAIPEGTVVPEHDEKGHRYRIMTPDQNGVVGNVYPSVTGKLQIIKDESLINYKKNQVIEYVFKHYREFTDNNIMEHLSCAEKVPETILNDASDVGTDIHNIREKIFKDVIEEKVEFKDIDFLSYIPPEKEDVRIKSAIRALNSFVHDYKYKPIATELYVYSHKLKVSGTLDDIGIITKVIRDGDKNCTHELITNKNESVCLKCGFKEKQYLVLLDVKTSNQFKDHYFFQVALYYQMFCALTDVKPEICFILKLSKTDGTYKIEEMKQLSKLADYAKSIIKTSNGICFIRNMRKDNQKIVGNKLEFDV